MLELLSEESIVKDYSIKKIIRYNHRSRLHDENVAEHTFFVILFCLRIIAQLNLTKDQERQILVLAALHDACESRTSDIPYDIKKSYPQIKQILKQIEFDYYKENWEKYFDDVYKPDDLVYNILKLADVYSVYQWSLNEQMFGNRSDCVTEIHDESKARLVEYTNTINNIIDKQRLEVI